MCSPWHSLEFDLNAPQLPSLQTYWLPRHWKVVKGRTYAWQRCWWSRRRKNCPHAEKKMTLVFVVVDVALRWYVYLPNWRLFVHRLGCTPIVVCDSTFTGQFNGVCVSGNGKAIHITTSSLWQFDDTSCSSTDLYRRRRLYNIQLGGHSGSKTSHIVATPLAWTPRYPAPKCSKLWCRWICGGRRISTSTTNIVPFRTKLVRSLRLPVC